VRSKFYPNSVSLFALNHLFKKPNSIYVSLLKSLKLELINIAK